MAEMILTIAIEVVKCVAKCVAPSARRRIGYLREYKSNFEMLKTEVEKLKGKRTSIQRQVDAAKNKVEEVEENVQNWLEKAEEIEGNVQKWLERASKNMRNEDAAAAGRTREDEEENAGNVREDKQTAEKKRWLKVLSPGLKTRYQLGKEAVMQREAVVKLLQVGEFDQISHPIIPKDPRLCIKDFETFESRESTFKNVVRSLNDPDVNIVGIYGMGGIGKTTLAKQVANHLQTNKLFDSVVFVEIGQNPDIMKIQKEIGEKVGLSLSPEENESTRAGRLCKRLKNENNILIILDNIWDRLDLQTIGIPRKDEAKGCKLLLTARIVDVLLSKCNFPVGFLNDEEAWNLFKHISGRDYNEGSELATVAREVANKCAHLPILIVTVARALSNKPLFMWKDFLQQMGMSSSRDVRGIHASLELSYKYLEDEVLQKTLLLVRYANLTCIDELLMCGMSLGLFDDIKNMEGRRARVQTLVQRLKDSCLLLDGNAPGKDFSMHDVVRDVVLQIASRDLHAFTNEQVAELEWGDENTLKAYHSIVLKDVKTGELPPVLECQQLKLLSISAAGSASSLTIQDDFFTRMAKLKVLVLVNMDLSSPPKSLRFLSNLQALGLYDCRLDDVAILGELKKLEILSLRNSKIRQLSLEVGQLIRLKSLDLRVQRPLFSRRFNIIPPYVISRLSNLEELYIGWFDWDKMIRNIEIASLDELKQLSKLTCLEINMTTVNSLPIDLSFKTLERYKIQIGSFRDHILNFDRDWFWSFTTPNSCRKLRLSLENPNICLNDGHIMHLKGIEDLCLDGLQNNKSVVYELDRDGFPQLKYLQIQNNGSLLCIVDSMEYVTPNIFPVLESLLIRNLVNLEKICRGQITTEASFSQLKKIKVKRCDKLDNIFSFSIAKRLQLLESIDVSDCKNVKDIFEIKIGEGFNSNSEVIDHIKLSQLRSFKLKSLPQLKGFCSRLKAHSTSQQRHDEIILENDTNVFRILFTEQVVLPNLEVFKLAKIDVQTIWQNQVAAVSSGVKTLTSLIISGCNNLTCLFLSSIASNFIRLQCLKISHCQSLEGIVVIDEGDFIEFPSLKNLYIQECPKLKQFMTKNTSPDELTKISLSFFNEKVFLPNLDVLELGEINVQMIWQNEVAAVSSGIRNLTKLQLSGCGNLRNLCSSVISSNFVRLQYLKIINCQALEEIIATDKGDYIEFPILKNLEIKECPKLKQFMMKNTSEDHLEEIPLLFFNEKVAFPNLEDLYLINCDSLECLFSSSMVKSFGELQFLLISNCSDLEVIFDMEGANSEDKGSAVVSQLNSLHISDLPKLKHVWNKDTQGLVSFQNLENMSIDRCDGLKDVFPTSIASSLSQLESFHISNCGVEEIVFVADQEGAETITSFMFPMVDSLKLENLPNLTTFFSGMYTVEWPAIKELQVGDWEMMKNFLKFNKVEQSQILFEKVLPNLKELILKGKGIAMIEQIQAEDFIRNLKYLEIELDESFVILLLDFLQRFHYMKKLRIQGEPNIGRKKVDENGMYTLIRNVNACSDLKHIWKEESNMDHLVHLEVCDCVNLINNLVPSSTSFQSLTTLDVENCYGLTNIATSSTTKSLVQLREMTVSWCTMLTEVVAADEGDDHEAKDYEIVFSQLKKLSLSHLESLTSFCSANYILQFPSLKELIVENCPKMKSFCRGELSTPKLQKVKQSRWRDNKWSWKGDLNTTMQDLHEE